MIPLKSLFQIFLIIGLSIFSFKCQRNHHRQIQVNYGCDNIEILRDIDISINNNEALFTELDIEIVIDTTNNDCGYILKKGSETIEINSVLTDVDLMMEVKRYFK